MPYCPVCSVQFGEGASVCPHDGVMLVDADPLVGRTVAGKYRIDARLGAGGMGAVYRATQLALQRTVAVKVVLAASAGRPVFARRFEREAIAVARLKHPHIVSVYDYGTDPAVGAYIVMEYLEGDSLRSVLRRSGRVSPPQAVAWMTEVCSAIHAAHLGGIVHRDLKPDNIFLEATADGYAIKVLDFGIAKMIAGLESGSSLTGPGGVIGTPVYMSPEQCEGGPVGPASDIYALGCVLYELVTGRPPFESESTPALLYKHAHVAPVPPRRLVPGLPEAVEAVILRALEKRPEDRFASAGELRRALPLLGSEDRTIDLASGPGPLASTMTVAETHPTPPTVRNNLPKPLSRLVGRDRDAEGVRTRLAGARLVTLTGPGGIGKTRLAVRVAGESLAAHPDGVWLVDLAVASEADAVLRAVAGVLEVREDASTSLADAIVSALGERHVLIVLDNCEHLVTACAALVERLLSSCERLRVLATSREPLGVRGEVVWSLPPLSLPTVASRASVDEIAESEAVALFVDRAQSAKPSFALTADLAPLVADLCSRLDGIPLAIELAAARVKALSVAQILEKLASLGVLRGGGRSALPRHQTLRATIEWSYALLDDAERSVLTRCAVFVGGWELAAAEAICASDRVDASEVVDVLERLVDKSLVVPEDRGDRVRYRLLATIGLFARELLAASGEADAVAGAHRAWFAELLERAFADFGGAGHERWRELVAIEHENALAALAWGRTSQSDPVESVRLAVALGAYWDMYGHWQLGREWLEWCLEAAPEAPAQLRTRALFRAGTLAHRQGDLAGARARLEACLPLLRPTGNARMLAETLSQLGVIANNMADRSRAEDLLEQALEINRAAGQPIAIGSTLYELGAVARDSAEYSRARSLLEQSLAEFETAGFRQGVGVVYCELGLIAVREGAPEEAARLAERGLAVAREIGVAFLEAYARIALGEIAIDAGEGRAARVHFAEALALAKSLGGSELITQGLEGMAQAAALLGEAGRAVTLFGAASALRESMHEALPDADRKRIDAVLSRARATLGDAVAGRATETGRSLARDAAVALALTAV
jgi:predicted ATPase/serine/threonine protein kinase